MRWSVRSARDDDEDLGAIAELVRAITPERPTSVEEMRWNDATYPGGRHFVAERDGRLLGYANVGRIYMYPPAFPRLWFEIVVAEDARRQGIGSALLREVGAHTASAGKTGLQTEVAENHADGIEFLLHRGFEVFERSKSVRLELAGLAAPETRPPSGIRIVTLAADPSLLRGVHEVATLAFPDIPGAGEPIQAGPFDEFVARDVERPGVPLEAFHVAVDEASGAVVGYASLQLVPGRQDVAWHDMTATHPAWRGRGVASALKRATIAWAIGAGLRALETGNDEDNAPMRAINAREGYRPRPDWLALRGPLPRGMMSS